MHLRVRHAICLLALLLCMGASIAFAAQPDDVEASDIKTKADVLAGFKDPLQQRVAQLNRLTIATICFAALGGICGAMTSSKAKVASAVAAAVVVALTSVRVQVYHADIDSADAILAELEDLDDRVQSQFGLYKVNADQVNSERLRRGSATAAQDPEFASGMAEIEANAGKALEQLRRIDTDRLKLKKRVGSIGVTGTAKPSSADTGSLSVFPVVYAAGRNEPGWMKSLPNDPDYLQDRGESVCSANYGAHEYARYDGRRRLAEKLRASAPNTPLNTIIKAIDSSVQDREQYSVAENGRIHTYVWVRLFAETARSSVRAARATTPRVSWKGEGALPLNGRARVANAAANRRGTFAFDFSVVRSGRSSSVALDSISTTEDGSVGSTRWSFDVSTADGARLFSIPTRRLDDSGKPTVCWPQTNENLRGTANYDTPGTLRVEGFLGSDY